VSEAGLCAGCTSGQRVVSARGSVFWRCERSAEDPAFPKYPRLPVLRCPGYRPDGAGAAAGEDAERAGRPTTDSPGKRGPRMEEPRVETPKVDNPKVEGPKVENP
jgi:hypothetical protein